MESSSITHEEILPDTLGDGSSSVSSTLRHESFQCNTCSSIFFKSHDLKRHKREMHAGSEVSSEDATLETSPEVENEQNDDPLDAKMQEEEEEVDDDDEVQEVDDDEIQEVDDDEIQQVDDDEVQEVDDNEEEEEDDDDSDSQSIPTLKCEHCPQMFKKACDLNQHTQTHVGNKPFMCPISPQTFDSKTAADVHAKSHIEEKNLHCVVCKSVFSSSGSLKIHMRIHTGEKPFKCPHCDRSFRTSGHRINHITSHVKDRDQTKEAKTFMDAFLNTLPSGRNFHCTVCSSVLSSKNSLKVHMRIHTGEKPFKCTQCDRSFRTSGHRISHMNSHLKQGTPSKIITIDGMSIDRTHGALHPASQSGSFPLSSSRTPGSNIITINLEDDHAELIKLSKEVLQQQKPQQCIEPMKLPKDIELCAEPSRYPNATEQHADPLALLKDTPWNADPLGILRSMQQGAEAFDFPNGIQLSASSPNHSAEAGSLPQFVHFSGDEKPYPCTMCRQTFIAKPYLEAHLKMHSTREKSFQCEVCNTLLATKGSLKVHMRIHTGERPFKCPHCELSFRTSGHRISHMNSHFRQRISRKFGIIKGLAGEEMPGMSSGLQEDTEMWSLDPDSVVDPSQLCITELGGDTD